LAAQTLNVVQTTKSGKKREVNLRDRLFALECISPESSDAVPAYLPPNRFDHLDFVTLRYVGSCRNDGTLLRPEHVIDLLEQVNSVELHLLHVHRRQLLLGDAIAAPAL
jgi:uncharacterized protein (DUF2344 family)